MSITWGLYEANIALESEGITVSPERDGGVGDESMSDKLKTVLEHDDE